MSRFLNYVIFLGDEDDFARIDELEYKEGQTVLSARSAIHANHNVLFLPRNIDSTSLVLYKSRQNLSLKEEDALLQRMEEVERCKGSCLEGFGMHLLGTDQLDPNLVHLVVTVQGPDQ